MCVFDGMYVYCSNTNNYASSGMYVVRHVTHRNDDDGMMMMMMMG